jgi:hypothetical protein
MSIRLLHHSIEVSIMAKKAKRRGRPPGSKNKNALAKVGKLAKSVSKMDVGQLRNYIAGLESTLAAKVQQQREFLEGQLAGLQIYASNKAGAAARAVMRVPNTRSATTQVCNWRERHNPFSNSHLGGGARREHS